MRGWKTLLDLSNNAWHGIGDTSTDVNKNNYIYFFYYFYLY
jgi:hypothetical protein